MSMYVSMYVRMYLCMYVCMDGWMDGWMCVCISFYAFCMYAYMYEHVFVHGSMYVG